MDNAAITALAPVLGTLFISLGSLGVAIVQSRKTRAEAHAELEVYENALEKRLKAMADRQAVLEGQLQECEARDGRTQARAAALHSRVLYLERALENVRAGRETGFGGIEDLGKKP